MKRIFTCFFLICATFSFGQARVGFTVKEIKEAFPDGDFSTEVNDDGSKYLALKLDGNLFGYYFHSEEKINYKCVLIPRDFKELNRLVKEYNETTVQIDDRSWSSYMNGSIVGIDLLYDKKSGLDFFVIYYRK